MRQDYYTVLGVSSTASAEEIRQAYRQLARQWHPDANPDDPRAADYFKTLNEAYRVLGTPEFRAAYDDALRRMPASPDGTQNGPAAGAASMPRTRPTPPQADGPLAARMGGHTTGAPSQPALAMRLAMAQDSIVPPRELTRFYMLAELGPQREAAVIDPLPLDLALVIDRSSSMRGEKIFNVKRAVHDVLKLLGPNDLVTLVFFDDRAEVLADGQGMDGRPGVENALNGLSVRGGTVISNGLEAALQRLAARPSRERVSALVLLSDGRTYNDEDKCVKLASDAREIGISITAMGLGLDWNRDLLDQLAATSGGSSNYIENPMDLSDRFLSVVKRLRATLAANMRLKLEPAPGVKVARATRVAPEIAEAFSVSTGALTADPSAQDPITVEMGSVVGRPDVDTSVLLWEVVLDPATFVPYNGTYYLGRLSAHYWAPRQNDGQWQRLEQMLTVPVNQSGQHAPIQRDVRLALELITAYRLQAQADTLKANGQAEEAAKRMTTAALRLRSAGSDELANQAESAARMLANGTEQQAVTETLRVKYDTKNLGIFHRLRRHVLGA
jgi:hypothetical protein